MARLRDDPGFCRGLPYSGGSDDPGYCRGLPYSGSTDDPGFAGVCPITDPAFTKPKNVRGATAIHPPPPVHAQGIEGAQKSTRNIERIVGNK
jgi:hypothetical protein